MIRTYSELMSIESYEERFKYLQISGTIGVETFGSKRPENQRFYKSEEWKRFRNEMILRDQGYDMGHMDYEINGPITLHHINPLTEDEITTYSSRLTDPENVICVSDNTHKAIHYGTVENLTLEYVPRTSGDTKLW